ncbi:trans-sulfuration enzyme family protein [Saccharospirillum impatiens]|uniref:trans-sulfuration enzyme family protein n=1 Tax=Saccharospirillum impatiens TaxID=169438 RepID=UPI00041287CB|nr:aminotransferase class I/II-fold pyridoxal phosphate-dependent enzyme [Saccharospirillum impatiens]
MPYPYQTQTLVAQAFGDIDATTGALIPAIHNSTTYQRDPDNQYSRGRIYSRADNPGYEPVERVLTELEQGADALVFASGMAASVAVFQALQPGVHVIAPVVMYWSLRNWLKQFSQQWQIEVSFVDTSDTGAVAAALRPGKTELVWLETPGNPLWTVADIEAICGLAHDAGARVVVDSTVATPIHTQPLVLGADLVMHSATKYLNGHSDVIAGALVTARDDEFWQRLIRQRAQGGAVLGPFEAALLLRGMRTLAIRVRECSANAQRLAEHLQDHPSVEQVLYPGLPGFAGHDVAVRQMRNGFGGMLSVRIKGGAEAAIQVAATLKVWKRATSLGGVESLVEHRASIEGEGTPVPDDLLRLSVGIEAVTDLIADFDAALNQL